ncbi:rhodanese-like domain-containing protein [Saccharopolyspora sp. NPDC050389]|uniref:rhodanese-like domain-containing protein n=1 Tax=Saccharopolyspora sp. NPDC050389 TaxID=3155516 RepID=UPI0033EC4F7B
MTRPLPSTVDVHGARELLEEEPRTRLIDVRTPGEFAAAHIPGSRNVPLDLLRERRSELAAEHADPVVLVCGSGVRAEDARNVLTAAGLRRLSVLEGGITAWEQRDAPVVRSTGKWAMERQVRLVAGSLVLTGVLGSVFAPRMKWLAGFIGGGLTFSALSNTCAMARVLSLVPYNRTPAEDAPTLLAALTAADAPAR